MKASFKYSKIGQMLDVLRAHAVSSLIFSFLWISIIMLWSTAVGGWIFTLIAAISYFFSIYFCGERAAKNDAKPYIEGEQDMKKCFYIPSLLIAVNLLFLLIYKLTWVLGSNGESIQKIWAVVTNILSFAWFSVYGVLTGMDKGNLSVAGYIIIFLLPYISYFLGYLAGVKKFDISEHFARFMYEKKKK